VCCLACRWLRVLLLVHRVPDCAANSYWMQGCQVMPHTDCTERFLCTVWDLRMPFGCGHHGVVGSHSRALASNDLHICMNMHVPRAMPYVQELLAPLGAELRGNLLPRLWRAFLALAEHAIKAWQGHCFGCTLNVLCVLQLHDDVPGNHRMHVGIVNCSCHGLCSCSVSCSHLSRATTWHSSMLLVAQQQTYCAASRR
jgi:hypothetical protein